MNHTGSLFIEHGSNRSNILPWMSQ